MKKIICLFFCLIFICANAQENVIQFNRLTIDDGISNSYVNTIIQDKKGFVWVGTNDGLNRYDGYRFEVYRHNPFDKHSIGGNSIRCLYEDKSNNLWIGLKDGGLSKYDPSTGFFINYAHEPENPNSLRYNDVAGICEDKNGLLWLAVDRGGLSSLNPSTGDFIHYSDLLDEENKLRVNASTAIAIDPKGYIWIATWGGGISRFDPLNKEFSHFMVDSNMPDDKLCSHPLCLFFDSKGELWIGTYHGGLYRFNTSTMQWKQYSLSAMEGEGVNYPTIQSIAEDADGRLWIATNGGGINIFDKEKERFIYYLADENNPHSLLIRNILCLYPDNAGSMWIGTSRGINFYNPLSSRFKLYRQNERSSNSVSDNYIQALLKDSKGNIWVGSMNNFYCIHHETKEIKRIETNKSNTSVLYRSKQAMLEDKSGKIWIGTQSEYFSVYDPATGRYEDIKMESPQKNKMPYRKVTGFYEDADGSIWIASEIGTLNYHPKTKKFTSLFQSESVIYPEDKSRVVLRDSDGELWIGTEGGLRRYGKNLELINLYTVTNLTKQQSISNNYVTSLFEDKEQNLWIGTRGGLHRFNKPEGTFKLITRPGEILGDPIMGILEDTDQNLWLSTTIGLLKYNPATNEFQSFDENDGLQSHEFNAGVCSKGADGELLFGGINGFNAFYPQKVENNMLKPMVLITDFQIFNKSVIPGENSVLKQSITETKEITLKHEQSVISFQFVAFNYISSQKNLYAYKLEGFDRDWVYTDSDRRYATYTNLDPGEYVFKVKASNNDGIWNEEGTEIWISVLPPLWKTWWAYTIYIVLIVGLIAFIITYFFNKERYKIQIRMAKLEARQQHEIDQLKLNVFTNISHEFRTTLTLIIGPLDKFIHREGYSEKDKGLYTLMFRNAQRLTRLVNQLLDFRKLEAGKLTLHLAYEDIVPFMKELTGTFDFYARQRNITYSFVTGIEHLYMVYDADKLDKVFYNLISNAFNHTADNGKIEIFLNLIEKESTEYVEIKVCDNGAGIPKDSLEKIFTLFYQQEDSRTAKGGGTGIGLSLSQELVLLHSGKIFVESEVNKGSAFTVLLPVTTPDELPLTNIPVQQSVFSVLPSKALLEENTEPEYSGETASDMPLILVVEDNDDMRYYIKSELAPYYRMEEAVNGEEGLKLAQEHIPDIIISDIMMPVMDGMELLAKLKTDDRTSHIPVILLTAVQTEEQVVHGYEYGADDYVTKPFNSQILLARVANLLSSRRKLWEIFAKTKQQSVADNNSGEIEINPFISKITAIVEQHISDPGFGVDALADSLHMTAGQLTRKTKALMNLTPYNFIVRVRMNRAIDLITTTDKNITEIAFETGYQELSNFSRSFTKYFGVSPSQYCKPKNKI